MTTLTINDINTTVNGVPRIMDLTLAKALGFAQPRDIRKIIARQKEALERFGKVCSSMAQTAASKGGRPSKAYYLTEKQALFICTKSEAPSALDVTIEMVEVFYAVKTGQQKPVQAQLPLEAPRATQEELIALQGQINYYKIVMGMLNDKNEALCATFKTISTVHHEMPECQERTAMEAQAWNALHRLMQEQKRFFTPYSQVSAII